MQELMTTGGLCVPVVVAGRTDVRGGRRARGVFTFTQPNFSIPRVIVAGQLQAPPPGAPAPREDPRSGVVAERRPARRSGAAPAVRRASRWSTSRAPKWSSSATDR